MAVSAQVGYSLVDPLVAFVYGQCVLHVYTLYTPHFQVSVAQVHVHVYTIDY